LVWFSLVTQLAVLVLHQAPEPGRVREEEPQRLVPLGDCKVRCVLWGPGTKVQGRRGGGGLRIQQPGGCKLVACGPEGEGGRAGKRYTGQGEICKVSSVLFSNVHCTHGLLTFAHWRRVLSVVLST